jgi:sulfide dehydrogenase cytochrome subunit
MPSIGGLNFRYFYATMQSFRKDRRASTVMGRIAKGYRSGDLQTMALHYGARPWEPQFRSDFDRPLATKGGELHHEHCEKCHKDSGHFQDKDTPPLAGQAHGYLLNQMRDYRVAASKMPQPPVMQERLEKLSDADLLALAEFYASPLAAAAEAAE